MKKEKKPLKPRDLGLLLWFLLHRVPVDQEVTEDWVEKARAHCGMTPERLAEVRGGPLHSFWVRMIEKRARRLAYFRAHGSVPPGWTPPAPGEQDRTAQVTAMRRHRLQIAPKRAKGRRHWAGKDGRFTDWLATKLMRTRRIPESGKRMRILNSIEARFMERFFAKSLTAEQFNACEYMKLADRPRRRKRKDAPS